MMRFAPAIPVLVLALVACGDDSGPGADTDGPADLDGGARPDNGLPAAVTTIEIGGWQAPEPLLPGSHIVAELGAPIAWAEATLTLSAGSEQVTITALVDARSLNPVFVLPADALPGVTEATPIEAAVTFDGVPTLASAPLNRSFSPLTEPALTDSTTGVYQLGRAFEVAVTGALLPGEGETRFELVGDLSSDDGGSVRPIQLSGIAIASGPERVAALIDPVTLTPGIFEGTLTVANEGISGRSSARASARFDAAFIAPVPNPPSSVTVSPGYEVPVFQLPGSASAVAPVVEFTAVDASGAEQQWRPPCQAREGTLRCTLEPAPEGPAAGVAVLGASEGAFDVDVRLRIADPEYPVVSDSVPMRVTVQGAVQYVRVVYEPGFYRTLERFGLQVAAVEIERRAIERMNQHFDHPGLRFVGESDEIPAAEAYTTLLSFAGPDPSGRGLLGFDNSPGKDVDNRRLGDRIGGAQSGDGGQDEYGGVFVESFLFWSSRDFDGLPRPATAQTPDPLFDEVFGPFMDAALTLDEWAGTGGDRQELAAGAVEALAAMIGETSAHETGHALGLASPEIPDGAFHREGDEPLCLMESGNARPLSERLGRQGGLAGLCGDEAAYLQRVLPGVID